VQEHPSRSCISIIFPPPFSSPHNITTATFANMLGIAIIATITLKIKIIMHDDDYLSFIDSMEIDDPFAFDDGCLDAFLEDDNEEQKKVLFLLYLSESERNWKYGRKS